MQVIKTICGRRVEFLARVRAADRLIDVRLVDGGGCGPASRWVEAMALARSLVRNRDEYEEAMAAATADKEAARRARVAAHEAKQKRRAPLQSARTLSAGGARV